MKLLLLNTAEGLKPMYDDDYDEKRRLADKGGAKHPFPSALLRAHQLRMGISHGATARLLSQRQGVVPKNGGDSRRSL